MFRKRTGEIRERLNPPNAVIFKDSSEEKGVSIIEN